MDHAKQEDELEDLAEEELSQVPVVLSESEDEGLHRVSPPLLLVVVVPDLVQVEAGHPPALKVVPHEGGDEEGHGLEFIITVNGPVCQLITKWVG